MSSIILLVPNHRTFVEGPFFVHEHPWGYTVPSLAPTIYASDAELQDAVLRLSGLTTDDSAFEFVSIS